MYSKTLLKSKPNFNPFVYSMLKTGNSRQLSNWKTKPGIIGKKKKNSIIN